MISLGTRFLPLIDLVPFIMQTRLNTRLNELKRPNLILLEKPTNRSFSSK